MTDQTDVVAPETIEGWYALHEMYAVDTAAIASLDQRDRDALGGRLRDALAAPGPDGTAGWSAAVELVGTPADLMLVHFRPTLDALHDAQAAVVGSGLRDVATRVSSFVSVTEAGMYHLSAKLAREAAGRGGAVGDAQYRQALERALEAERASEHVQKRLYPTPPGDMRWVCFYPMDKRRQVGQNWYTLSLEERSKLMHGHGMVGRRYAGRVYQVITGAIGFDAWEWGVTLFARDPLEFKRLVAEMRYDEASSKYGEFGEFWVGRLVPATEWVGRFGR